VAPTSPTAESGRGIQHHLLPRDPAEILIGEPP
jgi:hypothetical protein